MAATILHNVDLYKYNTMRLHSNCKTMYVPHDVADLIEILKSLKKLGKQFHILSAGSNIIFADHVVTPIILLVKIKLRLVVLSEFKSLSSLMKILVLAE